MICRTVADRAGSYPEPYHTVFLSDFLSGQLKNLMQASIPDHAGYGGPYTGPWQMFILLTICIAGSYARCAGPHAECAGPYAGSAGPYAGCSKRYVGCAGPYAGHYAGCTRHCWMCILLKNLMPDVPDH